MNSNENKKILMEKAVRETNIGELMRLLDLGLDMSVSVRTAMKLTGWADGTVRNAMSSGKLKWEFVPRGTVKQKMVFLSSLREYMTKMN